MPSRCAASPTRRSYSAACSESVELGEPGRACRATTFLTTFFATFFTGFFTAFFGAAPGRPPKAETEQKSLKIDDPKPEAVSKEELEKVKAFVKEINDKVDDLKRQLAEAEEKKRLVLEEAADLQD